MDEEVKAYKNYDEQVDILASRGMEIDDPAAALAMLRRVNYYRLSGYWYPFREIANSKRQDSFLDGTRFEDVIELYDFDQRLRVATFAALIPVELAVRAVVSHELGKIHPCVHLDSDLLGPVARNSGEYPRWRAKFDEELSRSREEFVAHHAAKYGGRLPVWAATEFLDWGSLTMLFDFAPVATKRAIADKCGLTSPQLRSWLKALNVVRNTCDHHGRLFNRVHALTPKLPAVGQHPDLDANACDWSRRFGHLTLIQFLSDRLNVGRSRMLPAVMRTYPDVRGFPISAVGAPADWDTASPLWD